MDIENSIMATKQGFEHSFSSGDFYNKQTQDEHHFPDIQKSISKVSRVIKQGAFLFISDPTPNVNDTSRFVDGYMQLKKMVTLSFIRKMNGYRYAENMGCKERKI